MPMPLWRRALCFVFGGSLLIVSGRMLYGHLFSYYPQSGRISVMLLAAVAVMAFVGFLLFVEATFSGFGRRR